MIRWLRNKWYAQKRDIDIKILWPSCVAQAKDIHHAKAAFAAHAFNDPAWDSLGHDGIVRVIDNLK